MEEGRRKGPVTRRERGSGGSSTALFVPRQTTQTTGRGVQPDHDYFKQWATSENAHSGDGGLTVNETLEKVVAHHMQ